jgi:hypothetical protein
MNSRFKVNLPLILSTILVLAALLFPRVLELGQFVTADEPLWLARSANFTIALLRGDFINTYQKEHPGVTILWAGAGGLLWQYPEIRRLAEKQSALDQRLTEYLRLRERSPLPILVAGRLFVALAVVIALSLAYLYAVRLLGLLPALLGFLLIAFDPFSIAHTRLLHLDGLVAALMLLSLLAIIACLYAWVRWGDLVVSAIAAGLSWLTKSPGLFLAPFVAALGVHALWSLRKSGQADWRAGFRRIIVPLTVWMIIALIVYTLLWPAMWVDPLGTIGHVISGATGYAVEGHDRAVFFDGAIFENGSIPDWRFYPTAFLWRATPVLLIGLVLALSAFLFRKRLAFPHERQRAAAILFLFALSFSIFMSLGDKKFDRYLLPAFGPLYLVAAVGYYTWLDSTRNFIATQPWSQSGRRANLLMWCSMVGIVLAGAVGTVISFPYTISYYNPWFGGSEKASAVMQVGWGEGLDQAARYLNGKPDANQLKVMSWYPDGPFSHYFVGRANMQEFPPDPQLLPKLDYVVIYTHQWQRQLPSAEFLDFFARLTPEHSVWINGIEYARIYRMH